MKNINLKLDTKKFDKLIDGIKRDTYKVKVGVIGAIAKQKDSETGITVAGYGSYEEINNLPINIFVDLLHYEEFCEKYENAYYERLRQKNKK